jgi:cytochrome c biogenesis protein CcmG/thiol:disulfide interchange protein DsbE
MLVAGCSVGRVATPAAGHRPIQVEAPDLEGRLVRVAEAGGQVRVVDFWATWCEPCREQLAALDRLSRQRGRQGPRVYAVSVDEDRAQLDAYLRGWTLDLEVLWDRGGGRNAGPLDLQRLPTTLVVDRAGLVRHVHEGFRLEDEALIQREVRLLLAEPAPAARP